MTITHIHKSFSKAWCGLGHAEAGTRMVSQTGALPLCTQEAGFSSEVRQGELLSAK
jgi:hypothetical protein